MKKYNISNRKAYIFRLRMSASMLNDIEHYATQFCMSKSKFIRFALIKLITELKTNE